MNQSKDAVLRLLLVDDHAIVRSGMVNLLNASDGFDVVADTGDGESALKLHDRLKPDITLLDIFMPGMTGIECLRSIKKKSPYSKVLMLSSSEKVHHLHLAVEIGAEGYLLKKACSAELVDGIKAVAMGRSYFSPGLLHGLKRYLKDSRLTTREQQVLELMREGLSNPLISDHLVIAIPTVKTHVSSILAKLKAKDRAHAVAKGFEKGLLK
jgi:DNA-binding NarL/FixJ family response regulator